MSHCFSCYDWTSRNNACYFGERQARTQSKTNNDLSHCFSTTMATPTGLTMMMLAPSNNTMTISNDDHDEDYDDDDQ